MKSTTCGMSHRLVCRTATDTFSLRRKLAEKGRFLAVRKSGKLSKLAYRLQQYLTELRCYYKFVEELRSYKRLSKYRSAVYS
jgi:hypothetical protein